MVNTYNIARITIIILEICSHELLCLSVALLNYKHMNACGVFGMRERERERCNYLKMQALCSKVH